MDFDFKPENYPTKHPAEDTLTIKLLFTAVVVLFAVIVFILALYIYARCCILRNRRLHLQNRRRQIVIYVDSNTPTTASARGLDSVVLNSLPVFEYSSETHHQMPECAVCLSEFEERDKGRLLPKCNHGFHIDCIDMWFHSHSTCPLCRSVVEPVLLDHVVVPVDVAEPGPSQRRKDLAVIVPPRTGLNLTEMGQNYSPSSQTQTPGFKSPLTTRFLSLTRNRRTTPSGGVGSTSNEFVLDIDKGMDESTQCQSRVQTPR